MKSARSSCPLPSPPNTATAEPSECEVPAELFQQKGVTFRLCVASDDHAVVYLNGHLVDRDPVRAWAFGRATLIGDAAHPMHPSGSQAGSQAVIDARASIKVLDRSYIDLATPMGRGFMAMLSALAEDERLRIIRVTHRKRLSQRSIVRDGLPLGTVYLVGEDPVAFYGADGLYYIRST